MSAGRVLFVGCGPGAPDLLTLRAVRALRKADIIIWSASLLERQVLAEHTRRDTEIVEWPPATQRDILDVFDRARAEDLLVVRLKGGDPTLFGALEPELSAVRERGLACEIVPGVSALGASAAVIGREIATPATPLLLVDGSALGAAPRELCAVAIHGAVRDPRALQRALLEYGLPASTPCTVAIEVSRHDETLLSCTLDALAETVEDVGLGVLTLVLADPSDARSSAPD